MLGPVTVELTLLLWWAHYPHLWLFRLVSHRNIYLHNNYYHAQIQEKSLAVVVEQLLHIYTPRIIQLCLLRAIHTHLAAAESLTRVF